MDFGPVRDRTVWAAALVLAAVVGASAAGSEDLPDGGPNASIGDTSVVEGNVGVIDAFFTVTLSGSSGSPVTVNFATADGTATVAGADYIPRSGVLTFAPGQLVAGITVTVVGDVTVEPDETFFVNLSSLSGGGVITDGQGTGTVVNDDVAPEALELIHGYSARRSLASVGGTEKRDVFRIAQQALSAFEVVVDEASGDLTPMRLERIASDGSTVLTSAVAVGNGPARSLRWINNSSSTVTNETIRVRSGGCTTDCGPDDTYRIRAYNTTFGIPRFNNTGTQLTLLIMQNPSNVQILGTFYFWNASGSLLATLPFTLIPRGTIVVDTSTIPVLGGQSGSISAVHNGPYDAFIGKSVALEPATGFSFDTPMFIRRR
jgi:hypothetical protein